MPSKKNKRSLPSPSENSPASPTTPIRNIAMEDSLAKLHEKFDSFSNQLAKIDVLEQTISRLVQDNTAFREELRKKDAIIDQLSEKMNKMDQSLRSNSLRIHGLPVTSTTPASEVPNIVYQEIVSPILDAAKQAGDISAESIPPRHFILSNAFSIPSKKNSSSSPVIVKFHSDAIRSLIFKFKRTALPTINDLPSNRVRPKYSVYEDLTAANHILLRSFADDPRVKSAWSFGGQIRFKTHTSDTVYKASSLTDTYEKLVRPPLPHPSGPTPLMDYT